MKRASATRPATEPTSSPPTFRCERALEEDDEVVVEVEAVDDEVLEDEEALDDEDDAVPVVLMDEVEVPVPAIDCPSAEVVGFAYDVLATVETMVKRSLSP